jgi:hypothetical protein
MSTFPSRRHPVQRPNRLRIRVVGVIQLAAQLRGCAAYG